MIAKGKPKKKFKNRRERSKYPALDPKLNLKIRFEELDYDYVNKLTDKDKAWLNTFTEEYINANLNHKGKKLHKTKKDKKICYDKNNSRNRDILSRAKVMQALSYTEELKEEKHPIDNEIENRLLSKLDGDNND